MTDVDVACSLLGSVSGGGVDASRRVRRVTVRVLGDLQIHHLQSLPHPWTVWILQIWSL